MGNPAVLSQASMPRQPVVTPLIGPRTVLLRAPVSLQRWAPRCPCAHPLSLTPSPSQRPPRVQEGSQEPGSQDAAESAAQGPRPGRGREGGGQAARWRGLVSYLLFLSGGSMGLDLSRGQAPWPGGASTVSPPPPPQPFPRRRNQGGGARPAGR